ncbi:MAG: aldehyde dehydrogenase family protein, partial [Alistipes sp.]|nr:aldehyde dehydrogenase family protein [Alistipes sp.]
MKCKNTPLESIPQLVAKQREFFASGVTREISFRRAMLARLDEALRRWEERLSDALYADLRKSREESFMTEFGILYGEIALHRRKVKSWARIKCRPTPLKMWPSRSKTLFEPLGTALIIAPWNYPVQLLLNPLIGAVSSGCTAVLKPSPYTPHVSETLAAMIAETFPSEYIAAVEGDRTVNTKLLGERFDIIFFTGSPVLGRTVMRAAAENLTPVVLELGGKSPCIVDREADVRIAARRIAWGKTLNGGQTCIAPDYLMLHRSLEGPFVAAFAEEVRRLLGDDASQAEHFVRMVNERAFDRVSGYLSEGEAVVGGGCDRSDLYVEPTLLRGVSESSSVMREEIFGPVLPMLLFDESEEVVRFVNGREKPLAMYYFGSEKKGLELVYRTSSGGVCINDTIMHVVNENIPFGGTGNSGMGSYHGRRTFESFSHERSVVLTPVRPDLPFRYSPYRF